MKSQTIFDALKEALGTALVLASPNFTQPFMVDTEACDKGIGVVLQQGGHPIAYPSKALEPRSVGLSTYVKECMCMAILHGVHQWRSYLQMGEFIIRTDQKSLVHLEKQRLNTEWQHKALSELLGLRYRICYKRAKKIVMQVLFRVVCMNKVIWWWLLWSAKLPVSKRCKRGTGGCAVLETANGFGSRKTTGPIHSTTRVVALQGKNLVGSEL